MNIEKITVNDPKTKEPSVSLTLMLASFIVVLVAACLEMGGWVKGTSVSLELFWGCSALYFGRRFSGRGQVNVEKDKE